MRDFIRGFHGVRYQTKDVARAIAFYRDHLGFKVEHQQLPAFAAISLDSLHILLSGPGASGSDLEKMVAACKEAGLGFRNEMESGPGGKQIQLLDPDGNSIELFEAAH